MPWRARYVAVGEIFVGGRRLEADPQPEVLAVIVGLVGWDTDEQQPLHVEMPGAHIDKLDAQAQVGIGVAIIGRIGQRTGHEQVILAVVKDAICLTLGWGIASW